MAMRDGAKRDANGQNDDDLPARAPHRFLGSLKDALMAAARSDTPSIPGAIAPPEVPRGLPAVTPVMLKASVVDAETVLPPPRAARDEAARAPEPARDVRPAPPNRSEPMPEAMTRAIRGSDPRRPAAVPPRTQLVRGRVEVTRGEFHQDPVVGWLVVVGGLGLGAFRPIYEGNNTLGRARTQRIAIDFGDETISSEEQAYIRYDSADRSFLFVPNLSKTNVVSINNRKPTAAVPLAAMDVITMGRTQLAFVPFCGGDFDWSELSDAKG